MKPKLPQQIRCISGIAVTALILMTSVVFLLKRTDDRSVARISPAAPTALNRPRPAAASGSGTASATETVPLRPLPVSLTRGTHEWTAGDGMDPKVIEKIAHNPDEFIRMVEENERVKRRQLVYRNETVPMLLDRARNRGEPLRNFTLPGLDGMEVEVELTGIQLNQSGNGGSVTGRVKGRFNSMVSVGFCNGCESFNVLSPDDSLFLTADAREPGEVMVKEIDPLKYNPPAGTAPDFILTNQPSGDSKTK
jgi:hypothetical protein